MQKYNYYKKESIINALNVVNDSLNDFEGEIILEISNKKQKWENDVEKFVILPFLLHQYIDYKVISILLFYQKQLCQSGNRLPNNSI